MISLYCFHTTASSRRFSSFLTSEQYEYSFLLYWWTLTLPSILNTAIINHTVYSCLYCDFCRFNPFPHLTDQQQMTLKTSRQNYGKTQKRKSLIIEELKTRENVYYEQFLLLPKCFQKLTAAEASENICLLERVN